jgi:ribosomal protein S12 methylthiotransferase accessory factor
MRGRAGAAIPPQWLPFVGRRLGLVRLLSRLSVDPEDFDIHHVIPTETALGNLLGDPREFEPRAGGAGFTHEDAVNRAIGELLERYAALAYRGYGRITSSFDGLADRGCRPVPFETLTLFSREQYLARGFRYREFTSDTAVTWFEGTDLLSGSTVHVPGQLISLAYVPDAGGEVADCFYTTSCGCALATSVEVALLTGLLEFIERDAMMVRWYARLAPPVLDLSPDELLGRPLRRQTRALEIRFYDLTVDGEVPVVCVGVGERTERPCALIFGTAAGLDTEAAARKALLEAGQGRPFIKLLAELGAARGEGEIFDDFDSNVRFFAEPENAGYVEWFAQNTTPSGRYFPAAETAPGPAASLNLLLDRCARSGLTPIAFDMTTPELHDHGLFACRVFVPELVPFCVPWAPFFGHPRLARWIAEARQPGLSVSLPAWLPHPFA